MIWGGMCAFVSVILLLMCRGLYCLDAGIGASHHSRVTAVSDSTTPRAIDHAQLSRKLCNPKTPHKGLLEAES